MYFIGELAALTAAFLWSYTSILFTSLTVKIGAYKANFLRIIFACFMLWISVFIAGYKPVMSAEQVILLSLSGLIGLVFGDHFLFKAFEKVGPRITMMITTINPAMTAFIAYFVLDEVISVYGLLGMAVTLTGIVLVIFETPKETKKEKNNLLLGIFFTFLGAVGQTIGLILAKKAFNIGFISGFEASAIRLLAALILFVPMTAVMRQFASTFSVLRKDRKLTLIVILAAFLGPYLGITLSFVAISYTETGIASTLLATTPIFMLFWAKFIYKEKLVWQSYVGAVLAVIGVAVLFMI
jgi:drug/metabolite transporter (DMT)-like permease